MRQSLAVHCTYEDESKVIEDIGLFIIRSGTVLGPEGPAQVVTGVVTEGTFRVLRVQPALG
jgi:hypothetical protein